MLLARSNIQLLHPLQVYPVSHTDLFDITLLETTVFTTSFIERIRATINDSRKLFFLDINEISKLERKPAMSYPALVMMTIVILSAPFFFLINSTEDPNNLESK